MELNDYNKDMHYYVLSKKMTVLAETHTRHYDHACYVATQLIHRGWKTEKQRKEVVRCYVIGTIQSIKEEK